MEDLHFLLLASHIFENKNIFTQEYDENVNIEKIADWLKKEDHLKSGKHVDPGSYININIDDLRTIDLINRYNPSINMEFNINSIEENSIIQRLRFRNLRSSIKYISENSSLTIPILHGGPIHITGDVQAGNTRDLILNTEKDLIVTTSINIDGELEGDIENFTESVHQKLVHIIENTEDSEVFGFSIIFENDTSRYVKITRIRGWVVETINNGIVLRKIHNPQ